MLPCHGTTAQFGSVILLDKPKSAIFKTIRFIPFSNVEGTSVNKKLPKDLWPHIVNKEDYEGLINPVLTRAKDFQYLTHDEISEMNDSEKDNYFKQKSEQIEYDSKLTEFRDELEREDRRTSELENTGSCSDDDDY